MFLHIQHRCKIEQPATRQSAGIKKIILKQKCACGSSFGKIRKLLSIKMGILHIES